MTACVQCASRQARRPGRTAGRTWRHTAAYFAACQKRAELAARQLRARVRIDHDRRRLEDSTIPRRRHRHRRSAHGERRRVDEADGSPLGRALRAVVDLPAMGERQINIDCDVLQADGGTRTASITGAWVALHFAFERLIKDGKLTANPMTGQVAAVSCGLFEGTAVLDLDYPEDSKAQADANFVLTGDGGIVEVQGTAEDKPFSEAQFLELMTLAKKGVGELARLQRLAIGKN